MTQVSQPGLVRTRPEDMTFEERFAAAQARRASSRPATLGTDRLGFPQEGSAEQGASPSPSSPVPSPRASSSQTLQSGASPTVPPDFAARFQEAANRRAMVRKAADQSFLARANSRQTLPPMQQAQPGMPSTTASQLQRPASLENLGSTIGDFAQAGADFVQSAPYGAVKDAYDQAAGFGARLANNPTIGRAMEAVGLRPDLANDTSGYEPDVQPPDSVAGQLGRGFGSVGSTFAASALTGGAPVVLPLVAGAQSLGATYQAARDRALQMGADEAQAHQIAAAEADTMGLVSTVTSLPVGKALSGIAPQALSRAVATANRGGQLGQLVKTAVAEGSQEAAEEAAQMILQRVAEDDPAAFQDWQKRIAISAGAGAIGGGVIAGVQAVGSQQGQRQAPQDYPAQRDALAALSPQNAQQFAQPIPRGEQYGPEASVEAVEQGPPGYTQWPPGLADTRPSVARTGTAGIAGNQGPFGNSAPSIETVVDARTLPEKRTPEGTPSLPEGSDRSRSSNLSSLTLAELKALDLERGGTGKGTKAAVLNRIAARGDQSGVQPPSSLPSSAKQFDSGEASLASDQPRRQSVASESESAQVRQPTDSPSQPPATTVADQTTGTVEDVQPLTQYNLTAKAARGNKGDANFAIQKAFNQTVKTGREAYVHATANGFAVSERPPFKQDHYRVTPDGKVFAHRFRPPNETRGAVMQSQASDGRRRVIEARLARGENVPASMLEEFPDLAAKNPAATVREPWEMTRAEIGAQIVPAPEGSITGRGYRDSRGAWYPSAETARRRAYAGHKEDVAQAIAEGKIESHPDYPDLKPKAPTPEATAQKVVERNPSYPEVAQPTPISSVTFTTQTLSGPKQVRAKVYALPGYKGPRLAVQEYKAPRGAPNDRGYRIYIADSGRMLDDNSGHGSLPDRLKLAVTRVRQLGEKAYQPQPSFLATQSQAPVPPQPSRTEAAATPPVSKPLPNVYQQEVDETTPTIDRHIGNEVSLRRKLMAFTSLATKKPPTVQEALAAHLRDKHPDVFAFASTKDGTGLVPLDLAGPLGNARKATPPAGVASDVGRAPSPPVQPVEGVAGVATPAPVEGGGGKAETFRRQLSGVLKSPEEGDAVFALVEARAKAAGESVEQYLGKRVAGIERGGKPGPDALRQDPAKNLVVMHNLSAQNVLFSKNLEGLLAMPSVAIADVGSPITGFGEISLVAPKELIDPKASKTNRVYDTDVYSARYPQAVFSLKSIPPAWSDIEAWAKETYGDLRSESLKKEDYEVRSLQYGIRSHFDAHEIDRRGPEGVASDAGIMAYFASKKLGKTFKGTDKYETKQKLRSLIEKNKDAFESWIRAEFEPYFTRRIFAGFTNSGNRRYKDYTIDNVMKEMRKSQKEDGGEGFFYGAGSVRAQVAKKYKSIAQIQKDRGRVVPQGSMESTKDQYNDRLIEIASDGTAAFGDAAKSSLGFTDRFWGFVIDAKKKGRAFVEKSYDVDYDAVPWEKVNSLLAELQALPTEYFEAKIDRAVGIGEFSGAVIPDDSKPEVIDALRSFGVGEIATYKRSNEKDRARAIAELANKQGLLFQGAKGAIEFAQDGRAIIHAFESADVSTMVHEIGHLFRRDLAGPELAEAEKWAGAKDGQWSRGAEERFARGFERYLRDGKSPIPALSSVFAKFKQWLSAIYKTITGSDIDVKIPADMRRVYDSLFTEKTTPSQPTTPAPKDMAALRAKYPGVDFKAVKGVYIPSTLKGKALSDWRNTATGVPFKDQIPLLDARLAQAAKPEVNTTETPDAEPAKPAEAPEAEARDIEDAQGSEPARGDDSWIPALVRADVENVIDGVPLLRMTGLPGGYYDRITEYVARGYQSSDSAPSFAEAAKKARKHLSESSGDGHYVVVQEGPSTFRLLRAYSGDTIVADGIADWVREKINRVGPTNIVVDDVQLWYQLVAEDRKAMAMQYVAGVADRGLTAVVDKALELRNEARAKSSATAKSEAATAATQAAGSNVQPAAQGGDSAEPVSEGYDIQVGGKPVSILDADAADPAIARVIVDDFIKDDANEDKRPSYSKAEWDKINTAFRTLQTEVTHKGPSSIRLFAMPGQEAAMRSAGEKMAKIKAGDLPTPAGTVAAERSVKPQPLGFRAGPPSAKVSLAKTPEQKIKSVLAASAKETTRFSIRGIYQAKDEVAATDGRRIFILKGKFGEVGLYQDNLDNPQLSKGILKSTSLGTFPPYKDALPAADTLRDAVMVDAIRAARDARRAAIMTNDEGRGVLVVLNTDKSLGFASVAPDEGTVEINVHDGHTVLGAINPEYLADAFDFVYANGDKDAKVQWSKKSTRPVVVSGPVGKTLTVTMPINTDGRMDDIKGIRAYENPNSSIDIQDVKETAKTLNRMWEQGRDTSQIIAQIANNAELARKYTTTGAGAKTLTDSVKSLISVAVRARGGGGSSGTPGTASRSNMESLVERMNQIADEARTRRKNRRLPSSMPGFRSGGSPLIPDAIDFGIEIAARAVAKGITGGQALTKHISAALKTLPEELKPYGGRVRYVARRVVMGATKNGVFQPSLMADSIQTERLRHAENDETVKARQKLHKIVGGTEKAKAEPKLRQEIDENLGVHKAPTYTVGGPVDLESLLPEHRYAIATLYTSVKRGKAISGANEAADFINAQTEKGLANLFTPEMLAELRGLEGRGAKGGMTPDQMDLISRAIQHVAHLSKTERTATVLGQIRQLDEDGAAVVGELEGRVDIPKQGPIDKAMGRAEKEPNPGIVRRFLVRAQDSLGDMLHVAFGDGVMKRYGYEAIAKAEGAKRLEYIKADKKLRDVLDRHKVKAEDVGKATKNPTTFNLPNAGEVKMPAMEALDVVLMAGDQQNTALIVKNDVLSKRFRGQNEKKIELTEADIEALGQQLPKWLMDFGRTGIEIINGYTDQVNATSVAIDGVEIAEKRTGSDYYYPRSPDDVLRTAGVRQDEMVELAWAERLGFTKKRTGSSVPYQIKPAIERIREHIDGVTTYIHMAEPTLNVRKLIARPEVLENVQKRLGTAWRKKLLRHLNESQGMIAPPESEIQGAARWLLRNTARTALWGRLSSAMAQTAGVPMLMNRMTGKERAHMLKHLAKLDWVKNPTVMREMTEASGYFADRYPETGEQTRLGSGIDFESTIPTTPMGRWYNEALRAGFKPMEYGDKVLSALAYMAAKDAGHPDPVFRAEMLIRQSQNATSPMDRSGMMLEGERNALVGALALFSSAPNRVRGQIRADLSDVRANPKSGKAWARLAGTVIAAGIAAAIGESIRELWRRQKVGFSPEDKPRSAVDHLVNSLATLGDSIVPKGGQLLRATINGLRGKVSQTFDSPGMDLADSLGTMLGHLDADEEKAKRLGPNIDRALRALSSFTGVVGEPVYDLGVGIYRTFNPPATIAAYSEAIRAGNYEEARRIAAELRKANPKIDLKARRKNYEERVGIRKPQK